MTMAANAMIEAVWQAAVNGGLTERCEIDGRIVHGIYERPDETVLDGLAISAGHRLRRVHGQLRPGHGGRLRHLAAEGGGLKCTPRTSTSS